MTYGMSNLNGTQIAKREHIGQSIHDILTTPVGTRVKRRDYGSHIFDLVDSPANPAGALQMIAATAEAIERWEPRIDLTSASVTPDMSGKAVIGIVGRIRDDGEPVAYAIPVGGAQ